MKTIKVTRAGRPATREELNAAIAGRPLPPLADEAVNHPAHYNGHPSGVEGIQFIEHMNFCLGNAVKYIWRADLKNDAIEDLEKTRWYLTREIERRQTQRNLTTTDGGAAVPALPNQ